MTLEPHSRPTYGPFPRLLLAVLLPALMAACSTTGTAPMQAQTLPDEACLVLAEPRPPLTDPTLAGAIRNHVEVADLYHQLSARHRCLVEFERSR